MTPKHLPEVEYAQLDNVRYFESERGQLEKVRYFEIGSTRNIRLNKSSQSK